jgi:hypothetical protein
VATGSTYSVGDHRGEDCTCCQYVDTLQDISRLTRSLRIVAVVLAREE